MKTVGIITSFNSKKPAGLERTLIEQLRGLDKINKKMGIEYVIYSRVSSDLEECIRNQNMHSLKVIKVGWGKLWKEIGLFFAPKADAYLFNGPIVPLFFKPKNYFVWTYDFAYKYFGNNSLKEKLKTKIIDLISVLAFKRAKMISALSEATKDDICKFFKVERNKIITIYLGLPLINKLKPIPVEKLPKSYFFFIGTLKERKNVLRLIQAFAIFKKNTNNDYKLVIAGKKSPSPYVNKLEEVINNENLENDVIFVGHIPNDDQVAHLYKNATVFVFPSLVEGFGMPPLEAMSFDVPVITSNVSSLKEVVGEAAILIDPNDVGQIAQAMKIIVEDKNLRLQLIEKGREQIKKFSWDSSALKYNKLFVEFVK